MTEIESIADMNLFAHSLTTNIYMLPDNVQIVIKVKPKIYMEMMSQLYSMTNGDIGPLGDSSIEWFTIMFYGVKFKVVPDNGGE